MSSAKQKTEFSLSQSVISSLTQAPWYPLNYVKVLVQLGHEPLPPFKSKNIFGREQLYYPNTFNYAKYIYSVEGVTGLYRGLGMKIIGTTVGSLVYNKVSEMMDDSEEESQKPLDSLQYFIKQTTKELNARCWAVVFTQPFHVMGLRCMAQFIGGETRYSSWNVFQNSVEIYQTDGLSGFFSGLIPRLLFEASTIVLTNTIAYLIRTYVFHEKDVESLVDLFASLVASGMSYPLSVVSTVSCVTGSRLVAGQPPRMVVYTSWIEAFKHLYENNELKRGSSSFFRIYTAKPSIGFTISGPRHVIN